MIVTNLNGGLGNQLFQYAFGFAKAKASNSPLVFDVSDAVARNAVRPLALDFYSPPGAFLAGRKHIEHNITTFDATTVVSGKPPFLSIRLPHIEETSFDYQPITDEMNSGYFKGYWQSHKYSNSIIDDLRKYFFRPRQSDDEYIVVHVRRGDYLTRFNVEYHGHCSADYYRNAVDALRAELGNDMPVKVVTDDPEWCAKEFASAAGYHIVSTPGSSVHDDFAIMQGARHFVISNSSLSWWAARLRDRGESIIIAPEPWFGFREHTRDLLPQHWKRFHRTSGQPIATVSPKARDTSVSVIIPTSDRVHLLPEAVESALAQTKAPLEIILALNRPSEEMARLAADLAGKHPSVRVVRSERRSLPHARNIGLAVCNGEWCAILDDDDVWAPNKLERQLEAAYLMGADAVSCDFELFDENGPLEGHLTPRPQGLTWHDALILANYFSGGSCAVMKRSVLEGLGGFDESLISCEDHDMWRRIAREHRLFVVPERLVRIRRSSTNMTGNPTLMLIGELMHASKKLADMTDTTRDLTHQALGNLAHTLSLYAATAPFAPQPIPQAPEPPQQEAAQAPAARPLAAVLPPEAVAKFAKAWSTGWKRSVLRTALLVTGNRIRKRHIADQSQTHAQALERFAQAWQVQSNRRSLSMVLRLVGTGLGYRGLTNELDRFERARHCFRKAWSKPWKRPALRLALARSGHRIASVAVDPQRVDQAAMERFAKAWQRRWKRLLLLVTLALVGNRVKWARP